MTQRKTIVSAEPHKRVPFARKAAGAYYTPDPGIAFLARRVVAAILIER